MAMLKRRMKVEGESGQEVSNKYYLLHEAIYSFHRVLHEIWDGIAGFKPSDGEKRTAISASLFSRRTRMFHWLAISNWKVDPNTVLGEIREWRGDPDVWTKYCSHLGSDHSLRHTKQRLAHIKRLVEDNILVPSEDKVDVNHRLFSLYEGYHHNPHLYLDGIIYRNLKKLHLEDRSHQRKIDYVTGHYVHRDESCYEDEDKGRTGKRKAGYHIDYPWVEVGFYENGEQISNIDIDPFQCQEEQKRGSTSVALENEIPPFTEEQEGRLVKVRPGWDIMKLLNQRFFLDGLGKFTTSHFAVVPIYDVWIGREAWGSLCGNLLLAFKTEEFERFTHQATSSIEDRPLTQLIDECRRLSNVFTESATSMVLNEPIEPPYDLIDHFAKHLSILQDWRSVIVYQDSKPQYCYRWHPIGAGPEQVLYERKRFDCNPPVQNSPCGKCRVVHPENADLRPFFGWDQWDHDLLDSDYLPDISEEEKHVFKGVHLEFEYSLTACIPTDKTKRQFLEEEYIRQQLEVLRGLLPKVRARRAALRNAAVSIMGRNMSHNIGSHVLARLGISGLGNREEVARLLAFLQERMDFIAEVSTTRAFINLPTYFYGEAINYFGGAEALPGGEKKKDEKNPGQKLLLEHISGVENMSAKVLPGKDQSEEFRFGCPGGTVGRHALYVIIENIVRNTAKHAGTAKCSNVEVFVRVCDDDKYPDKFPDLYQVTVWDRKKNGQEPVELNDERLEWFSDKQELTLASDRTVKVSDGNKVTTADFIQLMIGKEPLIDEDGKVRPNSWGIREIYLAAAYLRSIPLEELEARVDGPPILQALLIDDEGCAQKDPTRTGAAEDSNNYKNLGYRFYLERAHVAAVIQEKDPGEEARKKLKSDGIDVHVVAGDGDDAKKEKFRQLVKTGFKHTYLVVPNERYVGWLDDLKIESDEEKSGLDVRSIRSRLPVAVLVEPSLDPSQPESVEPKLAEQYLVKMKNRSGCSEVKAFFSGADQPNDTNKKGDRAVQYKQRDGFVDALTGDGDIRLPNRQKIAAQNALVFDDHAAVGGEDGGVQFDYEKLEKLGFYEWYRSESAQRSIIEEIRPYRKDVNAALLTIAALTRILILDERLQGALSEPNRVFDGLKVGDSLKLARIFVPPAAECDLNHPKAEEIIKWIAQSFTYQDSPFAWNFHRMDFLVVHQGILDRLSDENGQKHQDPKQWLKDLAKRLGCEDRIVVCSGRGAPSTVPRFARFVPLSTILAWTIHRPSKFHLVSTLWHARHPELIAERR